MSRDKRTANRDAAVPVKRDQGGWPWWLNRDNVVTAGAVLVATSGWAISYRTQVKLAGTRGHFETWESWAWPGATEAAAVLVMLSIRYGMVRGGAWTFCAWLLIGLCSAIMVAANVIADSGDLLAAGMHSAVPVVAMAIWLLIVHGRPFRDEDRSAGGSTEDPPREAEVPPLPAPAEPVSVEQLAPVLPPVRKISLIPAPANFVAGTAVDLAADAPHANGHQSTAVAERCARPGCENARRPRSTTCSEACKKAVARLNRAQETSE